MPAPPHAARILASPAPPGLAEPGFLVLDQVTRDVAGRRLLERISLEVAAGESICLLGPSGCGKTVLLRAIAGLDAPTGGRILLEGRDITDEPPAARGAGLLLGPENLPPRLTAAEALGQVLRGRLWPRPRRAQRVAELLALLELTAQAGRAVAHLSSGQRQRLALARALATEPGLLLLDDPLSAQDPGLRQALWQELRAIQARLGTTLLVATQDLTEAMMLADRILVMSPGRVAQIGAPEVVYRHPANAFVAGFLGHACRFEAVVDAPPGTIRAEALTLPSLAARPLSYGTPVRAFARPEDLVLGPAAAAHEGHFAARVVRQDFLGPVCRLTLLAGGLRLLADANPGAVPAMGEVLLAAIPADRLLVFPEAD